MEEAGLSLGVGLGAGGWVWAVVLPQGLSFLWPDPYEKGLAT